MQMSRTLTLIFSAPVGGAVLGSTTMGPRGCDSGGGGVTKRSRSRPGRSPPRSTWADAETGNNAAASAAINTVRTRKTDPSPHPGPIQELQYRRSQRDLNTKFTKG